MKYLIKNARVIDPTVKKDEKSDVLIAGGKIEKIAKNITEKANETIDAENKILTPGLVDMHVHFRQPGFEDKETIYTGSCSALKGGFTTVLVMPNTIPCIDNPETIKQVQNTIKQSAEVGVEISAAITKGRLGQELCSFEVFKKLGIKAVSDDGNCVSDDRMMRFALKRANENELLVISHCEDKRLSAGGAMNKGFVSTKLGLRGIPKSAEYEIVKRDIELAKGLGSRLHIAHVSCKESCEAIKKAKSEGVKVTAETAPHYFTLTEQACQTYDTRTKMSPPLRTAEDVEFIKKSLADGTLDAIATDHAPHGFHDKYVEFDKAEFGIIGLETALALSIMHLIEPKIIDWKKLVELMSINPAKILELEIPCVKAGARADITIINPEIEYSLTASDIISKSKNSPFLKQTLKGLAEYVFVGGKLKVKEGRLI